MTTWWLIPLSKWLITPIISGLTLLLPFITGVITHLLSGMSHQVVRSNTRQSKECLVLSWRGVMSGHVATCRNADHKLGIPNGNQSERMDHRNLGLPWATLW